MTVISVNLFFHPKVNTVKRSLRKKGKTYTFWIRNVRLKSQSLKNKDKITVQNKGINVKDPIFSASDILLYSGPRTFPSRDNKTYFFFFKKEVVEQL